MGESGAFVRPASVPKQVWLRYKTFRVEDIPDDRREECTQHFIDHFFQDEPLSSTFRKNNAAYSNEDLRQFIKNALEENCSLCAVDEANNNALAGVTLVRVASRAAPHRHQEKDAALTSMKRLVAFLEHCHEGQDMFTYERGSSRVVVDHVLEPMGLSVSREYRGQGIGQALIEARHKMAVAVGMGATWGIYTSIYSQAIILRQGMRLLKEVPYDSYLENGVAFFAGLNPPHPSCKMIGGLLPQPLHAP
ncbi:uncharacterized protein LOC124162484 [Ischnura elegans]|uniref:uncharacterized protein LOC124162484 n=1 Tax=Ischnura elegans TaxID=197161 RepID=UPI001ED87D1A|nr:uncharacterized protein LOC124162484 [Ischnura elegans]